MADINPNSLPIEMQYSDVLNQITRFYGSSSDPWNEIVLRSDSANPTRIAEEYLQEAGIKVIRTPSGRNVTYARSTVLDSYSQSPVSTPNSNVQSATTGGNAKSTLINGSATTTTEAGTKTTTFSKGAKAVGTGTKVMTVVSEASGYVFGARAGGWLGLQFSQELYDHGVSWAWSKDDWADFIQNDADALDKAVFSFLTGIDANGNATMYADELAVAQYYMMLREMGAYNIGGLIPTDPETTDTISGYNYKMSIGSVVLASDYTQIRTYGSTSAREVTYTNIVSDTPVYAFKVRRNDTLNLRILASHSPFTLTIYTRDFNPSTGATTNIRTDNVSSLSVTYNNKTVYYGVRDSFNGNSLDGAQYPVSNILNTSILYQNNSVYNVTDITQSSAGIAAYMLLQTTYEQQSAVDGIEKDPQASTYIDPSLIDGQDRDTVLQQLKTNYPELFDGSIYQDVPQDDGTDERITYVPVPYVKPSNKPTTGSNHQNNPSVNTETNTESELDDLIKLITQLLTPTDIPDTGTGETPPTVIPVGGASSLWKIYNPTQAQVDAFGSWLWDSSFVEQIKKLFNDPMQAIIGIHKVFATPSTGGTATIKVGYLDSQVSSAWVDNQYTTVNCGSASLKEYFGNVFDYAPYTKVQLYLPFIGIVDLDVGDVMRSTISVVYHVDVLTGACLADVKVNRDGVGGVLYQYAGSAIVTYPVSAGNYMGMLAGVVSVAGGIAGTILSGGALAPALIGGAVGASHLHTDVSHSGGFSGCAGAMGSKKPYLIVSRPQIAMADNYQHYTGIPANSKVTLGNCNGYAKVKSVYVNSITRATEEEKNMIEAQLKAGVLV